MIALHQVEQGTNEWDELRSGIYTGSNADKLLAHSTQFKVVDGIASGYALTEITGFGGNFHTRRGHLLEDEAIELYQEITGEVGIRFDDGSRVGFVTNSLFTGCGYSPDDIYPEYTVECKAFTKEKHLAMLAGNIPLKVLAQCHFGMVICGKKLCKLLPYNPYFAKKEIDGVPNPDYDPSKALGIIPIKYNRNIANNFKRIIEACNVPTARRI
jgi:hypothetical protein